MRRKIVRLRVSARSDLLIIRQVAAVDGERTDGADRALVHEQGVVVGTEAGIDCADATGGATGVLSSSVNVSSRVLE